MRLIIKSNYDECAKWTADYIAGKIAAFNPTEDKPFVLGLPTGSLKIKSINIWFSRRVKK